MTAEWWWAFYGLLILLVLALICFKNARPSRQHRYGPTTPKDYRLAGTSETPLAQAVLKAHQAAVDLDNAIMMGAAEQVRTALYRTNTTAEALAKLLAAREEQHRHES